MGFDLSPILRSGGILLMGGIPPFNKIDDDLSDSNVPPYIVTQFAKLFP